MLQGEEPGHGGTTEASSVRVDQTVSQVNAGHILLRCYGNEWKMDSSAGFVQKEGVEVFITDVPLAIRACACVCF